MEDKQLLEHWYRYAAQAGGFLGRALRSHRAQASLQPQQQRAALGIAGTPYDGLWRRLQAMPLPRTAHFTEDVQRIIAYITEGDKAVPIDEVRLGELILAGLH